MHNAYASIIILTVFSTIQAVQLFMSVAVEQAGIDYHVVLAQNALQQCLDQPELQSEFICALVKQTSRHTQHRLGVQVKKAARLVSLSTARVVSPAYCLTKETTLVRPMHSFLSCMRVLVQVLLFH